MYRTIPIKPDIRDKKNLKRRPYGVVTKKNARFTSILTGLNYKKIFNLFFICNVTLQHIWLICFPMKLGILFVISNREWKCIIYMKKEKKEKEKWRKRWKEFCT